MTNRTVHRRSCTPAQVLPWCFLGFELPVDDAIRAAALALGIRAAVGLLTLAWKLRAAADGSGRLR